MSAPKISVIICSHNPREEYLERALGALQQQTLAKSDWEFLLIDNQSDRPLARTVDLSWHPGARHLHEPRLGLTFARLCGIANAKGDILVFLDDDNVAEPDYLEQAARIGDNYPWLGAWGGQSFPEFEATPPEWTRPYWCYLALRNFEKDVWSNQLDFAHAPCGAGMCVRVGVGRAYAEQVMNDPLRQMLDRKGKLLASGGDSDLAFTACDLGMGIGLFRALKLTHIIPEPRLESAYLTQLLLGISYSTTIVSFLHGGTSVGHQRSRAQRLFDRYLLWRMPPRQRLMHEAYLAGKNLAILDIDRLKRSDAVKETGKCPDRNSGALNSI